MSPIRQPPGAAPPPLADAVAAASPPIRRLLRASLEGDELGWREALPLCHVEGADLEALGAVADELRRRQAGDAITYVVNRNINFTNVCVKSCHFCAFSRLQRSEQAYLLDEQEVVRRALEARALGATEVCIQAGLPPGASGSLYPDLARALKRAAPDLHLHAFSPEEVKYGAKLARRSIPEYLAELKRAGADTLPGTSAEVLDDEVRAIIAPGRITTAEWIEVVQGAHRAGLPTTATLMFGHVETDEQRLRHLDTLRRLQRETGGFTEFVPLSFIHEEAPMHVRQLVPGLRAGASEVEVKRLYAIARLMLGATFRNLQVSWVKQGLPLATELLRFGANDLGGTLMNESISTAAGAAHGQFVSPARLRAVARAAGRPPAERNTRYHLLRRFPLIAADDEPVDALDRVVDPEAHFGTYAELTVDPRFRFRKDLLRVIDAEPQADLG